MKIRRTVIAIASAATLAVGGVIAVSASAAQASTPKVDEFAVCKHLDGDIVAYKLCRQAIHWDPRTGPAQLKQCEVRYPNRKGLRQRQNFYTCEAYITDRQSV